jgi:PAS domain S-box-containing protein
VSSESRPCLVVGMGASAGGLKAFKAFFSRMPADTCMAFVLVPHLDPTHQSLMHELLSRETRMPVCEAEEGMTVERSHVYIIPPARYLTFSDGMLHLTEPQESHGTQTAIDHFLRSLAKDQQERSVGIILSGTGSHGSVGVKEIKLAGGMMMVQQPQSAEYDQMPRSAIATGAADYVLPPEQMPEALVKYANHPYLRQPPVDAATSEAQKYLNRILDVLRTRTRHDFRSYRENMLMRRVQRRMSLCHIEKFPDYLDYLRENTGEVTAPVEDLLIGVTGFFREPAPASVLMTRTYAILGFLGPTVNYLEFPSGEPTLDLMSLVRPGLPTRIRVACRKAIHEGHAVTDAEARVKRNGNYVPCTLTVRPLTEPKEAEGLLLVTFQDRPEEGVVAREALTEAGEAGLVQQREYELKATHDDLQSTIEELESSNEELRVSNEEVMSMNEELQSANEELEPSKEELQSLNAELVTLNQQLQEKVEELEQVNNDITNLLASSEVATVFLDTELRIKRFTPPTQKLLKLLPTDVGRPFGDFSMQLHDATLLEDCRRVLECLKTIEQEIQTDDQHCYLRRILPHRTADNRIDGVVILFIDITERVAAEARARLFASVLQDSNDAVTVQDFNGRITAWNRGAERMFGYGEAEALGMNIHDTVPADRRAEALELVERIAAGEDIQSFETQRLTRDGHTLDVWLTLTRVNDAAGIPVAISTTERDITASKRATEELRQLNEALEQRIVERTAELQRSAQEFHTLADNVPALFSYLDADQRYHYVNRRYEAHWKRPAAEIIGKTAEDLLGPAGYALARPHIRAVLAGQPVTYEAEFDFADARHTMQVRLVPDFGVTDRVQGFYTLVNDITELKQAESAIREREARLRVILDTAPDAIFTIDSDGKIQGFNRAAEAIFGYAANEVLGRNVSLLMPSPYREAPDGYLARYLETRESRIFCSRRELPGRHKDGSSFPMELTVSEIEGSGLYVGIARDISARRELEREVIHASTFEQERIGQELHDGLGQRLTGLSLMVEGLRQGLNKQQLPEAATTVEILEQLKKATQETRAIAHGLVPVPLTEQGLSDALRKLAKETQTATGISCRFTTRSRGGVVVEDRAIAMQLYRIAQEMIHNAVRHAQASHITLSLNRKDRQLELSVSDDGKGFQPDSGEKAGYGLRIMRYRAAMIGCELTIDSTPGKGTVARCILPC